MAVTTQEFYKTRGTEFYLGVYNMQESLLRHKWPTTNGYRQQQSQSFETEAMRRGMVRKTISWAFIDVTITQDFLAARSVTILEKEAKKTDKYLS